MTRAGTQGMTIIEVLVAIAIIGIITIVVSTTLASSIQSNGQSRQRSSSVAAAQSWLDRYRTLKEPLAATASGCSGSATITCTYPRGHNYGADADVPSHVADGAAMNAQLAGFDTTVVLTRIGSSTSSTLWQVQTTVRPNSGGGQRAVLTTRFTQ